MRSDLSRKKNPVTMKNMKKASWSENPRGVLSTLPGMKAMNRAANQAALRPNISLVNRYTGRTVRAAHRAAPISMENHTAAFRSPP